MMHVQFNTGVFGLRVENQMCLHRTKSTQVMPSSHQQPSSVMQATHQEGDLLVSTNLILHILYPKCVMSLAIRSYSPILVGNQ